MQETNKSKGEKATDAHVDSERGASRWADRLVSTNLFHNPPVLTGSIHVLAGAESQQTGGGGRGQYIDNMESQSPRETGEMNKTKKREEGRGK
jgi:hypothetical protein